MQNRESGHNALGPYQINIIIEPPREARPGEVLIPPLALCLHARGDHREDESLVEDLSSYWASVSLVSEDGLVALAPPSTTLISGILVDSVREAYQMEHEGEIGYFLFQNLSINQPGNFRFCISLMQMPTGRHQTPNPSGNITPSFDVMNIGSTFTRVIRVYESAPGPHVGESA
ncbi:MAG: hypothetical protein Q9216_006273 [Gyalolechia sp. 2 TL-2023]